MSGVNSAIIQAVNLDNRTVVGAAPGVSGGMVEASQSTSLGILMQNAVFAEKNMQTIASSSTAVVCALIVLKGTSQS